MGASVGDSEVWLYHEDYSYPLTFLQNIKPLIGSGKSIPIGFGPVNLPVYVLLGSDGLFKYTQQSEIKAILKANIRAAGIANLAKIAAGCLQDDISVILVSRSS